jgi:hypothetical protein
MSEGGFPREYGRGKWPVGRSLFWGAALLVAVASVLHASGWVGGLVLALLGGFLTWAVTREVRARTVVDADGVTVRGAVRVRHWAWRDVHAVEVEEFPDRPERYARTFVGVYDRTGRRTLLPHVNDLRVDVRAEAAVIRAVWRESRGADWTHEASVEAAMRRRAAARAVWEDAFLVGLSTFACMFVLFCVEAEASLLTDVTASAVHLLLAAPLTASAVAWWVLRRRARNGS